MFRGTVWKTYSTREGLPSNQTFCLEQGVDGSVWVGTSRGLCRLRGDFVEVFDAKSTPELRSHSIRALRLASDGRLWVGTLRGLVLSYEERVANAWTVTGAEDQTGGDAVRAIAEDVAGGMWAAVAGGLLRFDEGTWSRVDGANGFPRSAYYSLYRDRRGVLWAGCESQLVRVEEDRATEVLDTGRTVRCMTESPDGQLFCGTAVGVRVLTASGWRPLDLGLELGSPGVERILFSRDDGALWLGTREGLARGSRFPWRAVPLSDACAFYVDSESPPMALDREGNVFRLDANRWQPAYRISGHGRVSRQLLPAVDEGFWGLGERGEHVIRISLREQAVLQRISVPPELSPRGLFATSAAEVWLLTTAGLYVLSGSEWHPRRQGRGLDIRAIEEAPDGTFYVACKGTVEHWVGDRVESLSKRFPILEGHDFRAVRYASDGRVWLATFDAGIFVCEDTLVRHLTKEDGLASDTVSCIYEARDGTIWVGYRELGVGSYREGRWVNFTHVHGIPNFPVRTISESSQGTIWVESQEPALYGYRPGTEAPETWIQANPEQLPSHGMGVFSFSGFDAWDLTRRSRLEYSWRVVPRGGEASPASWSSFSRRTTIVTDPLDPGDYEFQVRAADLDRNVDATPETVDVVVAFPLWQTAEFLFPVATLLVVIAALGCNVYRKHLSLRRSAADLGEVNKSLKNEIVERQRAEIETQRLQERLQHSQKIEALGRVAGGMAHDFNNLLTVINGHSELLGQKLAGEENLRAQVEQICKAGERAAGLTRQLLAFSRKQVLELQVQDLREIVLEAERMLRPLLGERVKIRSRLSSDPQYAKADASQLSQVLLNLATNARDAMPDGGTLEIETSHVEVRESTASSHDNVAPGSYVLLQVSDTGVGMDQETLSRAFDPFFTTKGPGMGSGLGLSTVYGIITQCGGFIAFSSSVGHGTRCRIYLPCVERPGDTAADDPVERESLTPSETILLVEDEESVRALLGQLLRDEGYTVFEADGAQAAIEMCEREDGAIHLLLTDIVMPGVSGPQLAEKLCSKWPDIRVLYMSGYPAEAVGQFALDGVKQHFLSKPFSVEKLRRAVREAVSRPLEVDSSG